ncbi:hypothetical protein KM043_012765 [Ampulex compressa]|nr:hypothetical protein KM043_012765 [Ampulex compressa]
MARASLPKGVVAEERRARWRVVGQSAVPTAPDIPSSPLRHSVIWGGSALRAPLENKRNATTSATDSAQRIIRFPSKRYSPSPILTSSGKPKEQCTPSETKFIGSKIHTAGSIDNICTNIRFLLAYAKNRGQIAWQPRSNVLAGGARVSLRTIDYEAYYSRISCSYDVVKTGAVSGPPFPQRDESAGNTGALDTALDIPPKYPAPGASYVIADADDDDDDDDGGGGGDGGVGTEQTSLHDRLMSNMTPRFLVRLQGKSSFRVSLPALSSPAPAAIHAILRIRRRFGRRIAECRDSIEQAMIFGAKGSQMKDREETRSNGFGTKLEVLNRASVL